MNRLPRDLLVLRSSAYEIRRAQTLYPWYKEATMGLDLHALAKRGKPMVLDIKGGKTSLDAVTSVMPVSVRIQNVTNVQQGVPVGFFYGGARSIPVLEVEVGHSKVKQTEAVAVRAARCFLFGKKSYRQTVYRIYSSLRFMSLSYELPKLFRNFEHVRKGQILAKSPQETIRASVDGYTLFTRTKKNYTDPRDIRTEILFLARKMNPKNMRKPSAKTV